VTIEDWENLTFSVTFTPFYWKGWAARRNTNNGFAFFDVGPFRLCVSWF